MAKKASPVAHRPQPPSTNPLVAGDEGFTSVTPGTALGFDLAAENKCIVQGAREQKFGVVIELVADGFTVVASQPVTLIVPGN